jgi:hypothetical protein
MKKHIAGVLAAVCLLLCLMPAQRAEAVNDICFVALDDRLLDLGSQAVSYSGIWYVPYTVFSDFGINYSYFSNSSTAMLFSESKQMFFDLAKGVTYDGKDNYYSSKGILLNGVAYVPVGFVCSQFGLNWNFIYGESYGSVCRIKDGAAILTDSQFMSAAAAQMQTKYNAYVSAMNPVTTSAPTSKQPAGASTVYLSFQGLPSAKLLDALKSAGVSAAFFLSGDDIKSAPDTVRRLVVERHRIGILCSTYQEFKDSSELLYECAHVTTLLTAAPEGSESACRSMSKENGLAYCAYTLDGVRGGRGLERISYITSRVAQGDNFARILCGTAADGNIAALTSWFDSSGCRVLPADEINRG